MVQKGRVELKMQLRGRRRVDGVGRLKFDFHAGPRTSNSSSAFGVSVSIAVVNRAPVDAIIEDDHEDPFYATEVQSMRCRCSGVDAP